MGARVDVNGMQMYYEVSGAGEPLVVLHGAYMNVALFRLLGGGGMGDLPGYTMPPSRLAVMPATPHTSVITQPDLLYSFIEPFLKGEKAKGMFDP